jgi:hypothetical protein
MPSPFYQPPTIVSPNVKRLILIVMLAMAPRLLAMGVGDSRDSVIAHLGAPMGQMAAGSLEILRYPGLNVKLRDGHVVSVEKVVATAPTRLSSSATAARTPALVPVHGADTTVYPEPQFPHHFAGSPEFHTILGTQAAGSCCYAKRLDNPQVYLLSVNHLLGPMGGFGRLVPHEEVPGFVQSIRFMDLFDDESAMRPVTGLAVPNGDDPKGPLPELLAFKTESVPDEDVAILAITVPKKGEPVWLVGHVLGGVPEGEKVHPAKVDGEEGGWLIIRFDNPQIVTNGASGAPVINSAGDVVGIYQGHSDDNGQKYGFIIPSPLIIETLGRL